MRTLKLVVCAVTLSLCSLTAWAQGRAAPTQNGAPPPADLEPGVNTSATPPPSPEPEPAVAPAPAPKAAPTASRRPAPGAGSPTQSRGATPASPSSGAASAPANTVTSPSSAAASAPANTATSPSSAAGNTTAGPKMPGPAGAGAATKSAAAPKGSGKAHDSLELDTTQITGNRELPKVLYIVPWKRSDLGDLVGKPVNSLLDEVLTPVDRDVFKRQNRYYDALKPDAAGNAGAASDPGSKEH